MCKFLTVLLKTNSWIFFIEVINHEIFHQFLSNTKKKKAKWKWFHKLMRRHFNLILRKPLPTMFLQLNVLDHGIDSDFLIPTSPDYGPLGA
jgi:predicted SprT family Zn-dependent metalloprotease